jgi:hypothetical protein
MDAANGISIWANTILTYALLDGKPETLPSTLTA